jgi:rhodanese-related sulfurtransferase
MTRTIEAQELAQLMSSDEPYALLDVRERGEYAREQIFGAVPLPRGLLEVCIGRLVPWRDVRIVTYCDDGDRSGRAALTLADLGYRQVAVLDGGIGGWKAGGFETVYGVNVLGKDYGEKVAARQGVVQLTPEQVRNLQSREPVLVFDARTRQEYEKGHLPGAYSVPGGELPLTVLSLLEEPANRDASIVVHCAGRTRSILGADVLRRIGIERVYALQNGTMAWTMAGLPLERGSGRPLEARPSRRARETAAAFAERAAREAGVSGMSVDDLTTLRDAREPHYLIDVRLPDEFEAGHVPGAISCPGGQLANALDELVAVRRARIVCMSAGDTRARIGAALGARIGYPNVTYLEGGLPAWTASGGAAVVGRDDFDVPGLADAIRRTAPIEPRELQRALGDGVPLRLLDVRRSSEYALGHIAGSTWAPRGDLERRIAAAIRPGTRPIVVVSSRGIRAALAARTLADLGYADVRLLSGGLRAWEAAGFPLVEGLDGADVSLAEAKEDVDLVKRAGILSRDRDDMVRYLEWEERLGEKYEQV